MATPCFQASPQGQLDQDHSTSEQHTQTLRNRVPVQTRVATDVSIAEAGVAAYEFASLDNALANGHKEDIFDVGWWNTMDAWSYPMADMVASGVIPSDT
jgi:hypothetical protein